MNPRLKPARRGLSYADSNKNRLITVSGDVLGVKHEIESRWPTLEVYFDSWDERWVIVEKCEDGVDRLVFTTEALDQRVIDRLHRADQANPDYTDFLDSIDDHNAEIKKDQERRFKDKVGDFGERFLFALRKDGLNDNATVFFSNRGSNSPSDSHL